MMPIPFGRALWRPLLLVARPLLGWPSERRVAAHTGWPIS